METTRKHSKKKRQIALLGLMVFLLAAAYLGVGAMTSENETTEDETQESNQAVLFEVETENATELTYERENQTVTLIKSGESWVEKENPDTPLEQSYIENMLSVFEGTTIKQIIWETKEQAAEYGLDSPDLQVTLTMSDGTTYSYQVGMEAVTSSGGCYVTADGKDGIYLVDDKANAAFSYTKAELIATES